MSFDYFKTSYARSVIDTMMKNPLQKSEMIALQDNLFALAPDGSSVPQQNVPAFLDLMQKHQPHMTYRHRVTLENVPFIEASVYYLCPDEKEVMFIHIAAFDDNPVCECCWTFDSLSVFESYLLA